MKVDLFMRHHNTGFILRDKQKASRNEDEVGSDKMDREMKKERVSNFSAVQFQTLTKLDIYCVTA